LKLVHFVSTALKSGHSDGRSVFGAGPLRSIGSSQQSPPQIRFALEDFDWSVTIETSGFTEKAHKARGSVFTRSRPPRFETVVEGHALLPTSVRHVGGELVLALAIEPMQEEVVLLRRFVSGSGYFHRPDLGFLRLEGSGVSNTGQLDSDAKNLFTVLRNWRDQSEHEERFTFVMEGMAECFPGFKRLDFVGWGPRQGAELPQAGSSDKLQPSDWSDGFLSTLCLLTAAATVDHGLLAVDELENSLHPELIVRVMELYREWSRRKGVPIVIATHSPVVLDQFRDDPERVFVMQPGAEKQPLALDTLKKRDWLQHFSIGDLYAHGEVGSPG
jgi:predicted ATPase